MGSHRFDDLQRFVDRVAADRDAKEHATMTTQHFDHALVACMRQWCSTYNRTRAYQPHRWGAAALSFVAAVFLVPDGPIHWALVNTCSLTVISIAVWRPPLRLELLPHHAPVPDDLLLAIAHSETTPVIKAELASELQQRGQIPFGTLFRAARLQVPRPGYDALARIALSNAANPPNSPPGL